jgi:hypothetical protein
MPGDDGPPYDVVLSATELACLAAAPPTPMDDLPTGIRVMSNALWTKPGIPDDVRDRMREWIRGAMEILYPRPEAP